MASTSPEHEDGAIQLTAATIDAVLAASPGPTLLDFEAPWCGPCKAISPMIDELAREMAGQATVAKIDVEAEPTLATRFGVTGLPALLLLKGDKLVERLVGAVPKPILLTRLQALRD